MTDAEKFQEWKAAHYPTASRVHTQMMYAAWVAATSWNAPKAPPAPRAATMTSTSTVTTRRTPKRTGKAGDE